MLEFSLPWSMLAGGALVSSPIIIHLINRMRFKRVRWAAMEFLLKSQKRNRRKLIIEQLLLLALRCLMVLLGALIVARFLGFMSTNKPQVRSHVIVLDDTLSMNDQWKDEREGNKTSFKEAKRLIVDEIAKHASQAANVQKVKVIRLSNPDDVIFRTDNLGEESRKELETKLNAVECTNLHVDLLPAVKKARALLDENAQDEKVLYLVSDFRQHDWTGSAREALQKEFEQQKNQSVNIKFVDVAHPARKESEVGYHANLAITKLQPEVAVIGRGMPGTGFTVAVHNYGPTVREGVHVRVKLNGVDQLQADVPMPPIPANGFQEKTFYLYLDKEGINQVTANIAPDGEGLTLDKVRYATVKVEPLPGVPILAVSAEGNLNQKRDDSDLLPLKRIFVPSSGYDIAPGFKLDVVRPADLDPDTKSGKIVTDLSRYPNIYLLDVPELNEKARANLEAYVRQGGTVCFFLGDRVKADRYNADLYANSKGIFPVPLADRPTPEPTPKEIQDRREKNLEEPQPQFFLQPPGVNTKHRIYSEPVRMIGEKEGVFKFMYIDRHFPVPRERWSPQPGVTEELATLPNDRPMDAYKKRTQDLLEKLPVDNPKYKKYQDQLSAHRDAIRTALGGTSLNALADKIGGPVSLLNDPGNPAEKRPNIKEFWEMEENRKLAGDFERLAESVRYGDPLVVERRFGKGRCVVFLTTLGTKWCKWGEGDDKPLFAPMIFELQRYLMSIPTDAGPMLGGPVDLDLDAARYTDKMKVFFKPEAGAGRDGGKGTDLVELSKETHALAGAPPGRVRFRFDTARQPGVYVLELGARQPDGSTKGEPRAFAYNVDTQAESNLQRVSRADLEETAPGAQIYTLGAMNFTDLAERQRDLSQGPWLYLLFLLILVLEQGLAVHLSFHLHDAAQAAAPPTQPAVV